MNILYVSAEVSPFCKTGGLADVLETLPKITCANGDNACVILPKYKCITENLQYITHFYINLGWRNSYVGLFKYIKDNVTYYFIDNEWYFNRDNLYGYGDDLERFTYFCKAVVFSLKYLNNIPDVMHLNDWHTGILPLYLKENNIDIKTIFTVHNIKYQGVFSKYNDVLDLKDISPLEFNDSINFMKCGIVSSTRVTTVSPTYSREIQTAYYGEGMQDFLNTRGCTGILNGIIKKPFNINKKPIYKKMALDLAGFETNDDIPLFVMISRLDAQKGIDLLKDMIYSNPNAYFIFLGTGDTKYMELLKGFEHKYPDKIKVFLEFDNGKADILYRGGDFFLMPSLFEPCGISQMIAMNFGTIPIVRETGGLFDTVVPYNEYETLGTGFTFSDYNAMAYITYKACELYHNKEKFNKIRKNAMDMDFSWNTSAKMYQHLYANL